MSSPSQPCSLAGPQPSPAAWQDPQLQGSRGAAAQTVPPKGLEGPRLKGQGGQGSQQGQVGSSSPPGEDRSPGRPLSQPLPGTRSSEPSSGEEMQLPLPRPNPAPRIPSPVGFRAGGSWLQHSKQHHSCGASPLPVCNPLCRHRLSSR